MPAILPPSASFPGLFETAGAPGRLVRTRPNWARRMRAALHPIWHPLQKSASFIASCPFADIYFVVNSTNHPVHRKPPSASRGLANSGIRSRRHGGRRFVRAIWIWRLRIPHIRVLKRWAPPPAEAARPPPRSDWSTGWHVTLAGNDARFLMDTLRSWTDIEAGQFFRPGDLREDCRCDASVAAVRPGLYLDFGEGTPVTAEERRSGNGCARCSRPRFAKRR